MDAVTYRDVQEFGEKNSGERVALDAIEDQQRGNSRVEVC